MKQELQFSPRGVCSRRIDLTLEDCIVTAVKFHGGCAGNTQGISALVVGMNAEDVIDRLSGIRCGFKSTSCPDQLAAALRAALNKA